MTSIFCDDLAKAKNLLKHSSDMPTLQTVIVTGYTPNDQMGKEFFKGGLNIFSFEEVMDRGKRNLHPAVVRSFVLNFFFFILSAGHSIFTNFCYGWLCSKMLRFYELLT